MKNFFSPELQYEIGIEHLDKLIVGLCIKLPNGPKGVIRKIEGERISIRVTHRPDMIAEPNDIYAKACDAHTDYVFNKMQLVGGVMIPYGELEFINLKGVSK